MRDDKLVSIIFPAYNVSKYIAKAIESVLNQTYKNFELIIVDDGSKDETISIAHQYAKKDKRINIIRKNNEGAGLARKTGLKYANGDYILFIDPDDYIEKNCIEDIMNQITDDIDVVTFGHYDVTVKNNDWQKEIKRIEILPKMSEGLYSYGQFLNNFDIYLQSCAWMMWGHMYKRSYLLDSNVEFSSQKTGEDALFHIELFKNAFNKMLVINKPYYYYIKKSNSAMTSYHYDRFDCEINVVNKLYEFIEEKKLNLNKYKKWVNYLYINAVMLEVKGLSSNACPLTKPNKIKRIKEITSLPHIQTSLSDIKIREVESIKERIKIFLLAKKMYNILLILIK